MSDKGNKPKDTDFIELEKADFKKKPNFLKASLKYMIIFFIFFLLDSIRKNFIKKNISVISKILKVPMKP